MKDVKHYLRDMLEELKDVQDFTADGQIAFMADRRTQKAVIRSYEIIGEIAKRLPAEMRDANLQIDWRRLITFRDFLAHNYDMVILSYVWGAVEDLHNLRAKIEALLSAMEQQGQSSADNPSD